MRGKRSVLVAVGALFFGASVAFAGLPFAREKWSVGIIGGGQRIYGDPSVSSATGPGLHMLMIQRFSPKFAMAIKMGYTELDGRNPRISNFFTEILKLDVLAQYKPVEIGRVRPLLNAGFGGFNFQYMNGPRYFDGEFVLGGGTEIVINRKLSLQLSADYHWTTGDDLDGVASGGTDGYLAFSGGVIWNVGERLFGGGKELPELPTEIASETPKAGETDTLALAASRTAEVTIPIGSLADSVRRKVKELEQRVMAQDQKVETLRQVVEEKREQVARLEQEIADLESRISMGQVGDFEPRYKRALQLHLNHRHEEAIRAFSSLIRDFPNHNYVSNCHYWIGEAYFVLGDYQQAIRSFERVLNYVNSPKLDDALLMLGRANLRLGDTKQAAYYLNKLLTDFPDSEYVEKARRYLISLK